MTNTYSTLSSLFTAIANAIRGKTGAAGTIQADSFPAAIAAIPASGGSVFTGTFTVSDSGWDESDSVYRQRVTLPQTCSHFVFGAFSCRLTAADYEDVPDVFIWGGTEAVSYLSSSWTGAYANYNKSQSGTLYANVFSGTLDPRTAGNTPIVSISGTTVTIEHGTMALAAGKYAYIAW